MSHKFDDGDSVIRIYNRKGQHVMSILPCAYRQGKLICDIANPDGKVFYCGVEEDLLEVFMTLCEVESIKDVLPDSLRIVSKN